MTTNSNLPSVHSTPPSLCPHCGRLNNRSTPADGRADGPAPGDLGVCFNCAGFLTYGPQLELLPLSYDEVVDLPSASRTPLLTAQATLVAFKKARGQA